MRLLGWQLGLEREGGQVANRGGPTQGYAWGSDSPLDPLERPTLPAVRAGEEGGTTATPARLPTGEGGGAGGSAPWVLMGGHNADRKDKS